MTVPRRELDMFPRSRSSVGGTPRGGRKPSRFVFASLTFAFGLFASSRLLVVMYVLELILSALRPRRFALSASALRALLSTEHAVVMMKPTR